MRVGGEVKCGDEAPIPRSRTEGKISWNFHFRLSLNFFFNLLALVSFSLSVSVLNQVKVFHSNLIIQNKRF